MYWDIRIEVKVVNNVKEDAREEGRAEIRA